MREIVLDTETTGFDPGSGDRIVEIGALELHNHVPTGRTYHQYINPERGMPEDAFGVHGIGPDLLDPPRPANPGEITLRDKPVFAKIADEFRAFIGTGAKLIIHNAAFDVKFLNAELGWTGRPPLPQDCAIDTLDIARRRFPGSPASLDALCRRFSIDNSGRTLHGALLDSEILAEVYLELIGGKQPDLVLAPAGGGNGSGTLSDDPSWRPRPRSEALPSRLSEKEKAAHAAFVAKLGDAALWTKA